MKQTILIFIILLISCTKENQKPKAEIHKQVIENQKPKITKKNKSIDALLSYALTYKPSSIDLSKSDLFNKFDIEYIFNSEELKALKRKKDKIVSIILLKNYLYDLKIANQGYNLKSMRNGDTKIIINYFFKLKKVNTSNETINTSIAYDKLKKDKTLKDKNIEDIILKIDMEIRRIMKETNKIINGN